MNYTLPHYSIFDLISESIAEFSCLVGIFMEHIIIKIWIYIILQIIWKLPIFVTYIYNTYMKNKVNVRLDW